ncbi:MAG: phosphoribosylformylglycinamidine cyclo-ligase [Alphaproteobacteria bacterium]|nr:phosphoribosylformylglycinamidine cyclo-ligase [Alphaproteobacteria bacterium]
MKQSAYKQAGVDIDAGAQLVEKIKPAVKSTNRSGTMSGIGGFGALFDPKAAGYVDPILVSATDGVGTKLKIAIDTDIHNTVGIDLVAMCVNDLIVQGAEPLFFLDYFACGQLKVEEASAVIEGIAKGCAQANCALIGGETAEMPGMYAVSDYDLAGFTVGAVERNEILDGTTIKEGDVILGLAASGLHSNGYSLVRKIISETQGYGYDSECPFVKGQKFAQTLLTPTRIYVKSILETLKLRNSEEERLIKGLANITGGGLLENIPRSLPEGLGAVLDANSWVLPPLFKWLAEAGDLSTDDMARTLNCGIGMVVICTAKDQEALTKTLEEQGETVFSIGKVKMTGQAERVIIQNTETAWKSP